MTGKTKATFVFDHDPYGWELVKFIKGLQQPSLAVIGITDDGDVYSGDVSMRTMVTDEGFHRDGLFDFSFFSHGRCDVPKGWACGRTEGVLERRFGSATRQMAGSSGSGHGGGLSLEKARRELLSAPQTRRSRGMLVVSSPGEEVQV